jgi:hypothetical protein
LKTVHRQWRLEVLPENGNRKFKRIGKENIIIIIPYLSDIFVTTWSSDRGK